MSEIPNPMLKPTALHWLVDRNDNPMPESIMYLFKDYELGYSFETIKAKDNFNEKEKNCRFEEELA